jgi:hypothetical protein
MEFVRKAAGPFPVGVWIALAALVLLMLAWGMQAFSLLDWDRAVDLGLQNERFGEDPAERAWATESRGLALADIVWPLPVTIVALVGLLRRRHYGLVAGVMAFAIGVYFPIFFAFQRWSTYRGTAVTALCLWTVPCLLGIWGLWANRDLSRPGPDACSQGGAT